MPSKHYMKPVRIERGLRPLAGVAGVLAIAASALAPLYGQTHKVAKPETVVRAVGVYEWTGDMAKPNAHRLIPVSVFIDGKLRDAAVYLARPIPFALDTGNVYELQQAGKPLGALDILFSKHMVAAETTTAWDDGWFGYGKFVPPGTAKKSTLKPSKTISAINAVDADPDKPHFSSRSAAPGSGGSAAPTPGSTPSSGTPADDPDRPTMHRRADSSDKTASAGGGGDTPSDDPDRPTLRRRTAEQQASAGKSDQPNVTPVSNSLNDDPNRPTLHRGKPEGALNEKDLPRLSGLPVDQDLHQIAAVSDAADRPVHDFSRAWDDEAEHQAILTKMQTAARAQLAKYEAANAVAPPPAPPPPPDPHRPGSKIRRGVAKETPPPLPAPPETLLDEKLTGYELSYGGSATFVYSAHTDGLGPALRFVTLIAQTNTQGEPEVVLTNVTDATHLDRSPRMRLVDAVDAEASNRASLLFELRAQNSRQFALYRVIGARADQTFLTGSTQ